jgi:asparagine synthase (glutamine-hydrolysing)
MCGIWCSLHDTKDVTEEYIKSVIDNVSKLLHHRGPNSMGSKVIKTMNGKTIIMVHTRLHIIGESKTQPIEDIDNQISLVINGEIFNWKELSKELNFECNQSDCEILIPLYKEYIRKRGDFKTFFKKLNGQYSFVLYDSLMDSILVSRDHIGITPLYYGYDEKKIAFCSEMKCLTMNFKLPKINLLHRSKDSACEVSFLDTIKVFQPRQYIYSNINDLIHNALTRTEYYLNYYELTLKNGPEYSDISIIKENIRTRFEKSIHCQLDDLFNLNVNFGVLLSGGLDSSLVASIINKKANAVGFPNKIKTFSIGINKNSVDLVASRKVAKFLDSDHHEFYFTIEEGILAIKDTIYYTETYDTTTIRAGTAMYLLTKKIKEKYPELKVLFSGELSDELMCYLYGSNAPSENAFQEETVKLVSQVHLFDCLRANKTCMANSIEPRVPFTDPTFVKYILRIPARFKTFGKLRRNKEPTKDIMEKQLLRDSFNVLDSNGKKYLPKEILMRSKEAFSDGISTFDEKVNVNWIDSITKHCEKKYGTIGFHIKRERYSYNKPQTKEQLWYRELFCELFNKNSYTNTSEFTVKFWEPKWCGKDIDPSARKHIKEAFEKPSYELIERKSKVIYEIDSYDKV